MIKIIYRRYLCLLAVIIIQLQSFAQDSKIADVPIVLPPSPNAASLGKFGDIPVGLYTGVPNVSMPLHKVSVGSFSLPISLQYHSQGLKVEEISNWIGLGWALNAGGVITRTVRDLPDESGGGYWTHATWTNEYIASDPNRLESLMKGNIDLDPDVFYFNFNGRSGKFVLDSTAEHKAHILPYQSLKITHDAALSRFEVLDENGIKYVFDVRETTTDDNTPPTIRYFTSAWFLSRIVTPAGDITFNYTSDKNYYVQLSENEKIPPDGSSATTCPDIYGYQGKYFYIDIDTKVLSEITTPTEKIRFNVLNNRRDMPTASILESFTVEDWKSILKRKIVFYHSYFGRTSSTAPEDVRLKLDGYAEMSSGGDSLLYSFQYYDAEKVPSLKSASQDYWGFYNGKGNSTLLHYLDPIIFGEFAANRAPTYGIRDPDSLSSRVGTLKTIVYPTGGSSDFIYEGNDYGYDAEGYLNEKEHIPQTIQANAFMSASGNVPSKTSGFTLQNSQTVVVTIQGSYSGPPPVENGPSVSLRRVNSDGSRTTIFEKVMLNSNDNEYLSLTAGNYEALSTVDGTGQSATITVKYYSLGDNIYTKLAGGVRIKKIINTDPVTGVQNVKRYEYKLDDTTAGSSGCLFPALILVYTQHPKAIGYCVSLNRTSYSLNYLTTQGSHIGYSKVSEFEEGPLNTGRKESYFSATGYPNTIYQVSQQYIYGIPITMELTAEVYKYMVDFDFSRGMLEKEVFYNATNKKVKSLTHSYNLSTAFIPAAPNLFVINRRSAYSIIDRNHNGLISYEYRIISSRMILPWVYRTSSTEELFNQFGSDSLTVTTNYFFDNPSHAQLTRIESTNSKGQSIKAVTKYAPDKGSISNLSTTAILALDSMISINKVGPVIESESYSNGIMINRTRMDYRVWNPSSKIIEPEFVSIQNKSNPMEKLTQFYNYDDKANILEQGKVNDIREVYLWGYNKRYPVAKVIGVDYATAMSYVNQDTLLNPATDQQLRNELNKIRVGLKGKALVTTYTYSPLVGVTSETDPTGAITYYEYDGLGRLKIIRDRDGKILKQFDYQYQRPITQ